MLNDYYFFFNYPDEEYAVHENVNRVWLNDPPECVRDFLQADFSAVHSMS